VTDLAQHFEMTVAAVSKHILVLDGAGLVSRRREGRLMWVSMNPEALDAAMQSLARLNSFWVDRLDGLERFLARARRPQSKRKA
jgi:DNA-binding transcriptional ArsR family regulator